jgi:hypothetical protein
MDDDQQDQDAQPTATAPGQGRPQAGSTPSERGDPRTNLEAEAAAGGGPELDASDGSADPVTDGSTGQKEAKAAVEDADLTD